VRDRRSFAALRTDGVRRRSGPVVITARLEPDASQARVAYAIGRPVGTAVTRNRVRRRLRAIVRSTELAPGSYLVSVSPAASTMTFSELEGHVRRASASVQGA